MRLLPAMGIAGAAYAGYKNAEKAEYETERRKTLDKADDRKRADDEERRGYEMTDIRKARARREADRVAAIGPPTEPAESPAPAIAAPTEPASSQASESPDPLGVAPPATEAPALGAQTQTLEAPKTLTAAGATGGQPAAARPRSLAAAPTSPDDMYNRVLSQAKRVAESRIGDGDHAGAMKVMSEAYSGAAANQEAYYKFKIEPKMREIQDLERTNKLDQANAARLELRGTMQTYRENQSLNIYGAYKNGDVAGALRMFNDSEIAMPGVKAAKIENRMMTLPDGRQVKAIVMFGEDGQPLTDKATGQPLAFAVDALEQKLNTREKKVMTVAKGASLVEVDQRRGASRTLYTAPDPEAEGRAGDRTARRTRDDEERSARLQRQGRDEVRDIYFAGRGSLDSATPDERKAFGTANALVDKYVAGGMRPGEAAQRAKTEADEQVRRQKNMSGGGQASGTQGGGAASNAAIDRILQGHGVPR